MILLIDNYDSFTYNLYQYAGEFYENIKVVRNDDISLEELGSMNIEGIIISPGPGVPEKAGICVELIRKYAGRLPILGICLGHQAIAYAYSGNVIRAKSIRHGKTSNVRHGQDRLFAGIKENIRVMRYHSLVVDEESLPEELVVTAKSDDGAVMAIKHRSYELYGVQFHPESLFTEQGKDIIKNFLEGICNVKRSDQKNCG